MININLVKKLVVIVIVALLCFRFVVVTYVSANNFSMPADFEYPDESNYPANLDGAVSYTRDVIASQTLNTGNTLINYMLLPFTPVAGAIEEYFGIEDMFPDKEDFYGAMSPYYLKNGSSDGAGYRDGSPTLNTDGSYSWNEPKSDNAIYLDDGNGGFFTIIDNSHIELPYTEVQNFSVYHRGKRIYYRNHSIDAERYYKNTPSGSHTPKKPEFYYGTYTAENSSNACFWVVPKWGYQTFLIAPDNPYIQDSGSNSLPAERTYWTYSSSSGWTSHTSVDNVQIFRTYFTVKLYNQPDITNNNTTVYTYDPTTNNFTNNYYYGADDSGRPVLYDINNNNQTYNINSNGKVDSGSKELYLFPDMSTLNDLDFNYFKNVTQNYYNLMFINLINKKGDGNNSDLYGLISSCLSQLNFISQNEALQTLYLRYINENIIKLFDNMGNSAENGDLLVLLNMLKQGILGENLDNDNIIDLLKKIEENTRPVPEDFDFDDFDNVDINIDIQDLTDLIWQKLNVVSYFKQLDSLLRIFFGSYYSNQLNFDNYFNIDNYLEKSDSEQIQTLSTADFPDVYGEELASEDIQISSSYYLQQSLATASVSDSDFLYDPSADPLIAPSLTFSFFGNTYDLFDFITPDIIPVIRVFRIFIALICVIKWLFWVIKMIPVLAGDYNVGRDKG